MIMNDLKDVLRMTATVFLFVSFLGLLVYADETQEQQVERLIKLLQDQNGDVCKNAASTLGSNKRRCNKCGTCSNTTITGPSVKPFGTPFPHRPKRLV